MSDWEIKLLKDQCNEYWRKKKDNSSFSKMFLWNWKEDRFFGLIFPIISSYICFIYGVNNQGIHWVGVTSSYMLLIYPIVHQFIFYKTEGLISTIVYMLILIMISSGIILLPIWPFSVDLFRETFNLQNNFEFLISYFNQFSYITNQLLN